ncbi:MAG TPA: DUF2723 domain-containing protein [Polyangia bacterium]|nr:DUF2723 domain-containing protein [Polyangia bacterium]
MRVSRDQRIALLLGLGTLGVYVATVCPTVYVEDSPEFTTAAAIWGIPHPPGYPLYTLMAALFARLVPLGDLGLRANLFSAVCGASTVVALWALLRRLGLGTIAALVATLCFAFGAPFWSQCVAAEVHALNALLLVSSLRAALEATRKPNARSFALMGVAIGLAIGHRNLNLLLLLPLPAILERARRRDEVDRRAWVAALGAALATLLVYVYLPIAAARGPALDMGAPTTLARLLRVVTAQPYTRHLETGTFDTDVGRAVAFLYGLPGAVGIAVSAALPGFVLWRRSEGASDLFLAGAWLVAACFVFASAYNVVDVASYFIPAHLGLAIAAAFGFDALKNKRGATAILSAGALLGLPFGASAASLRHTTIGRDYGRMLVESAPPGAIVLSFGDTETHALAYAQAVEGRRSDAVLVSANELDGWYLDQLSSRHADVRWPAGAAGAAWLDQLVALNQPSRPVCLTQPLTFGAQELRAVPTGLLFCLQTSVAPADLDRGIAFWAHVAPLSEDELHHADVHVRMIAFALAFSRFSLASALADAGRADDARVQLRAVEQLDPDAQERAIVAAMSTIRPDAHRTLDLGQRCRAALQLEPRDERVKQILRF